MYTIVILVNRHVPEPASGCFERHIGVHNGEQKRPICTTKD
jgi:hypothetical protein